MSCSGYVLAGGRSSRMGRDKARLPFRGGQLAGRVAGEVERAVGCATLVGHPQLGGIPDRYPGEGPLGGILTALEHTQSEWNLIVACDMPEVKAGFLGGLVERAFGSAAGAVIPVGPDAQPQPLCAVYRKEALGALRERFERGERKLTLALAALVTEPYPVAELLPFHNVNYPEDWAVYAAE